MTDDSSGMPWPPAMFAEQFQEASEEAVETQQELLQQFMSANAMSIPGTDGGSSLGAMSMGTATFKARVQSGGRISIPDAEREALDIEEGDIVQTIVVPVKRNRSDTNE